MTWTAGTSHFYRLPFQVQTTKNACMVYSYKNVAAEFASKLTAEEAKTVEDKDGFLSANPKKYLLYMSPNFLI